MRNVANEYLSLGFVVLFDTMQTFFASSRDLILPPAATNALRLYVYPVRTTLVGEEDCRRHGMTFEQQVAATGAFNILSPLNSGIKGNSDFGLNPLKCVWATPNPTQYLLSQNPHYVFTVSTVVRHDQTLPNALLHFFLQKLVTVYAAIPQTNVGVGVNAELPVYHSMNMQQLLNYLDRDLLPTGDIPPSRQEMTDKLKDWFFAHQYSVSFPFLVHYRAALYCLAVADDDDDVANDLRRRLEGASVQLPSTAAIKDLAREDILVKCRQLEVLLPTCMVVKYRDGINRQWSSPWNIQSRSPICIYIEGQWRVMSAMPRGPEVAGHKEHGVTVLQDLNVENEEEISHFAPHYQTCIRAMQGNTEEALLIEESVCSSKRDGMCFRVTFLAANTAECQYWQHAIQLIDDEVVQLFASVSRQVLNSGLALPASNGTALLLQREVQYWMICSMALSYGITHDQLLVYAAQGFSPRDLLLMVPPRASSREHDNLSLMHRFILDLAEIAGRHASVEIHAWEAIGKSSLVMPCVV